MGFPHLSYMPMHWNPSLDTFRGPMYPISSQHTPSSTHLPFLFPWPMPCSI